MVSRIERLRTGITKDMKGIEVAPWLKPIVSKADGYDVRVLDVFDRETLLSRAKADPHIANEDMSRLEVVDFVGSATEIEALVPKSEHGTFDYIVSSHNFEHLPNPIKFLQGAAKVLKEGGRLIMAVPDRRGCFDFFRPHTTIGVWLDAFHANSDRPTRRQVFDLQSQTSVLVKGKERVGAFRQGAPLSEMFLEGDLALAYERNYIAPPPDEYQDSHCTVMTPCSLELLFLEARQLGLIAFRTDDIGRGTDFEFHVRLSVSHGDLKLAPAAFQEQRNALIRGVIAEYGVQAGRSSETAGMGWHLRTAVRPLARQIRAAGRYIRGVKR